MAFHHVFRPVYLPLYFGISAVLPETVKYQIRLFMYRRSLARQLTLPFNGEPLLRATEVDIPGIMNDDTILEAFEEDFKHITEIYPAGEIFGGVNPGDRRALYYLIAHFKPKRILEVGTHVGASTMFISCAMKRYVDDAASLTTVDITDVNTHNAAWFKHGLPMSPAEYIETLGLTSIVRFTNSPAMDIIQQDNKFDMIFLDGDHSAVAVYNEISASLKVLNPNGLILLHDFYPGLKPLTPEGSINIGPEMAAQRIQSEDNMLEFIPLGDLPWETKGGGSATSLALVAYK